MSHARKPDLPPPSSYFDRELAEQLWDMSYCRSDYEGLLGFYYTEMGYDAGVREAKKWAARQKHRSEVWKN